MSAWFRTVSTLCAPQNLFGSTGVYSPQGPEMVLECSGLMIARGDFVKRLRKACILLKSAIISE